MKHKSVRDTIRRSIYSLRRITPRKLANLLLMPRDIKLRRPVTRSKPPFMRINAYPYCNLLCPGCTTVRENAARKGSEREPIMSLDEFSKCVNSLCDTLLRIVLYDEGEPLLHPDIFKMVTYADKLGVSVTLSSNLSMVMSDERVEELVLSGLDHLIVAMDGTDQEVYGSYRIGGNLARVQHNLGRIIAARRRLRRRYPLVEVQYLDFGYNSHQIPEAKQFAKSVGTDIFSAFTADPDPSDKWLFTGSEVERVGYGCYHIWAVADVNSRGELVPCDFGEDRNMAPVGSLLQQEFGEIWNGEEMVKLRSAFRRGGDRLGSEFCKRCRLTAAPPVILR